MIFATWRNLVQDASGDGEGAPPPVPGWSGSDVARRSAVRFADRRPVARPARVRPRLPGGQLLERAARVADAAPPARGGDRGLQDLYLRRLRLPLLRAAATQRRFRGDAG